MNQNISEELLNAFADNELAGADKAELLERIAADADLRAKVCETWHLKEMVRSAHPLPAGRSSKTRRSRWNMFGLPIAACLLLLVGAGGGWFAHGHTDAEQMMLSQIDTIRAEGGRVVLHLFSDEPARMQAALKAAERLARERDKAGRPFRVEFIANGPGLHLLRDGGSPYAARVTALRDTYENLHLVACGQAMERLRERGVDVILLPGVEEVLSAESELATRLTQGWRYMQT